MTNIDNKEVNELAEFRDELTEFRKQDYERLFTSYKEGLGMNGLSEEEKDKELAKVLVPLLAMQSYHLPGNSWCADWIQFVANNHPVLGICAHHRLHPLDAKTRIVALIGTLVFGLAITCVYEFLFIKYPIYYQHKIWVSNFELDNSSMWTLTSGMLYLWTIGSGINTAYNLFMWHIAACSCMREGGCMENAKFCNCPNFGKTFLRIFVIFILILTVFVVLLKVIIVRDPEADVTDMANVDNYSPEDFGFILGYLISIALSFFVYYPFGVTLLFSGILGCGKLPVLGGRPREVAIEEKIWAKQKKKRSNSGGDVEQASSPSS